MKKGERSKPTVLEDQHPRKHKQINRRRAQEATKIFLSGMLVFGALVLLRQPMVRVGGDLIRWLDSMGEPHPMTVLLAPQIKNLLPPAEQSSAVKFLEEHGIGSSTNLGNLAKTLLLNHNAKSVSLVRTDSHTVLVQMAFQEPILRIQAEKLRLVSRDGTVHGEASSEKEMNLPLLNGIIGSESLNFQEDGHLKVTEEDAVLLREAVALVEALTQRHIFPRAVTYVQYRGFSVALPDSEIEVLFGRAPFAERPSRLITILERLKAKGMTASRIELDFDGKAFIKEKPL